ncbi:hypothetical protein GFS24_05930 [Chitinophaga sp. SYP-B3965]|uniref:hypothetical protein n=1 Tax=Chitinophaga sp. SYP-B3965 TaxID=2663120 RepID=UPI00129981E8|nr:hypothetical protein [Chitinophaga sp. SYP-B3965]MRG44642.1 hypothetical protein [Chitinophaga sp. SYP-B3965]
MLHDHGIGKIHLGEKITDVKEVIPFRDFAQAKDYILQPGPSSFYYYTGDILRATDSIELLLAIEHIFIGVDQNNRINIIIVHFFNNPEQDVPGVLTKYYGEPSSISGIQVENMPVRQHIFWNTADKEIQIGFSSATTGDAATYPMMVYTRTREISLLRKYAVVKRTWQF